MRKILLLTVLIYSTQSLAKIEMSGDVIIKAKTGKETYYTTNVNEIEVHEAVLSFDAKINEDITGTIAFWVSQENLSDATAFSVVDEVYLTHNFGKGYFKAGQSYLPFGNLSSNFTDYSNTYYMGSMQAKMVELGYESNGFTVKAYAMNSDYVKSGDQTGLNTYGAFAGYENKNFSFGLSYLSNMANSSWIGAHDSSFTTTTTVNKVVAGYGAYLTLSLSNFSLLAEYITTAEKLSKSDYFYYADKAVMPSTGNIELAYMFDKLTLAVGYQANNKIVDAGNSHKRDEDYYLVGANYDLKKDAVISIDNKMSSKDNDNLTSITYKVIF